jgi:DNA-directed RNA polymerase subunit RPC12/RpoP
MSNIIRFNISLPTHDGFIGRECNNPDCKRYFQVHGESIKPEMFCPYCGIKFSNNELLTEDQSKYANAVAKEKAKEYMFGEIDKMFGEFARKTSGNKYVKFTHKPNNYKAKQIHPSYTEHQVDSELTCPECNFRFQVYGIFGYCPGCRNENLLIYDANLEIIKQEIASSQDSQRALRHAYADLVSTFEAFSKKKAKLFTNENIHFQVLFEVRKLFQDHLGADLFNGLRNDDLLALRRVFQKRHAYEHYQGVIEEKYVRLIPEDRHLLNQKAELSLDEFTRAAQALRYVLDKMLQAIEKYKP